MVNLTTNTYTILSHLNNSPTPLTSNQLLSLIKPTTTSFNTPPSKNWGQSYFTSGKGYNSETSLLHKNLIVQVGKKGNSRLFTITHKGKLALLQNS